MYKIALLSLVIGMCVSCTSEDNQPALNQAEEIRFTSVPDIFNWNISNPQPGWEDTINWFFKRLKKEGPDFMLNAGDIMDARWWRDRALVEEKTEEYWLGYKKRFTEHGIKVYFAPGDHEYGDDKGLMKGDIARVFGEQFTKLMDMPRNGPANHMGRAYFVRKNNLLIVSLDTFEDAGEKFTYSVGDEQLNWMESVLIANHDAEFIIVQGHLPVVGPVKSQNSSASMLKDGTKSGLWKLMVKYGVDVYLCGEHHRITVKKHDGIWQIVHGALWGTHTDLNYLRGVIRSGEMKLELLEFDVAYSGGYIQNHPNRPPTSKPRETIKLAKEPRETGVLILKSDPDGNTQTTTASGWFEQASPTSGWFKKIFETK